MKDNKITFQEKYNIAFTSHKSEFALLVVRYIEKNSLDEFITKVNCSKKDVNSMLKLTHNYTLSQMMKISNINDYEFNLI